MILPLVIYAHTEADPFTSAMLASNESVDTFLQQVRSARVSLDAVQQCRRPHTVLVSLSPLSPTHIQYPLPDANFLFLSYDAAGAGAIQQRLQSRLAVAQNITPDAQATWPDRWLFAAKTIDELAANETSYALVNVLLDWGEYTRGLQYNGSGPTWLPRLDGHFQYCNIVARDNHSPSDPSEVGAGGGRLAGAQRAADSPARGPLAWCRFRFFSSCSRLVLILFFSPQPWPAAGAPFIAAVGDPCKPPTTDYVGKFVLADMSGTFYGSEPRASPFCIFSPNPKNHVSQAMTTPLTPPPSHPAASCTPDAAASAIMATGNATGVVLMAGADSPLIQLGADGFEDQGLWDGNDNHGFCSMVARDGNFLQAVTSAGQAGLPVQYATRTRNGSFFGVRVCRRWFDSCTTHGTRHSPIDPLRLFTLPSFSSTTRAASRRWGPLSTPA